MASRVSGSLLNASLAARLEVSAAEQRPARSSRAAWTAHPRVRLGLAVLSLVLIATAWGQLAPPYDPLAQDFSRRLQLPTFAHLLGTDQFGRDVLSRILVGALSTCGVALGATLLAVGVGIAVGLLCSSGGRSGSIVSRLLDGIQAFPSILLALLLAAVLDASYVALIAAIGLSFFPLVARVTQAVVETQAPREYIQAARVIGVHPVRILLRHVLPNGTSALLVQATTILALALLNEAALSYLGLGPAGESTSWGRMLYDARQFLEIAPQTALAPLVAISGSVLACNILGDGLRDVLDPNIAAQRLS